MDLGAPAFNPHLQRVLKTFQSAAMDSLRGPSGFSSTWGAGVDKLSPAELEEYKRTLARNLKDTMKSLENPQPVIGSQLQQGPMFLPMDTSSEKSDTVLEGKSIACFMVGGEKRLCLPQVLQTVLRKFVMDEVQEACSDLHIFLSRCNPEQLQCLKMSGDLPTTAPSCGLITKTDAERLCSKLLHSQPETYRDSLTADSFKVYHECFGKSKGIIIPELYTTPDAKCIKCADCNGLFNTEKFVGHTHKALENRTCHWGFDPANWRSYIHLAKDQGHKESLQAYLEDLKGRFSRSYKRKESPVSDRIHEDKKQRTERYYELSGACSDGGKMGGVSSTFRPWSPNLLSILQEGKEQLDRDAEERPGDLPAYLHQGPPKLLNPERVIPFEDQKRYERHFAPNVSLAPVPPKKQKCKELAAAAAMAEDDDPTPIPSPSPPTPTPSSTASAVMVAQRRNSGQLHVEVSDTDSISTRSETSVPSTPNDSHSSHPQPVHVQPQRRRSHLPQQEELSRWRQEEVELFKQALELGTTTGSGTVGAGSGTAGATTEKEELLHKFLRVRSQTDESIASLISATKDLQLEACDAQAASIPLRHELDAMQKLATQYREEIHAVTKKLDTAHALRKHQLNEVKTTYRHQLQMRENQYGEMHAEMLREVHRLRDELRKLGKSVPNIAYDFELMGECPKLVSPPLSPHQQQSVTATGGGGTKTQFLVKTEVKEEKA